MKRWAINTEIHNLNRMSGEWAAETYYWLHIRKKYGWGVFNGACDPMAIGGSRTYLGAQISIRRAVRLMKHEERMS